MAIVVDGCRAMYVLRFDKLIRSKQHTCKTLDNWAREMANKREKKTTHIIRNESILAANLALGLCHIDCVLKFFETENGLNSHTVNDLNSMQFCSIVSFFLSDFFRSFADTM